MNIVAIQKSTGMFLESHELGFDKNTLIQNALSCGFNEDDREIVYMAFAHQPFVSSEGIPCTAR